MSIFGKIGRTILKYNPASAMVRNAVLLVVKINFANLAGRMYRAAKTRKSAPWQKIEKLWKNIGGNPDILYNNVRNGMKVKAKHHGGNYAFKFDGYDYDGLEPVTTTAAVTTATPLIIKILNILKQAGLDKPENINKLVKGLKDTADNHLEAVAKEAIANGATAKIVNGKATLTLSPDSVEKHTKKVLTKKDDKTLYIALAVVVILFLFTFNSSNK